MFVSTSLTKARQPMQRNKTTDDFNIGDTVVVNDCDISTVCNGMKGKVIDRDAYTVKVQFPVITPEMRGYEDTRTGIADFEPKYLKLI